MKKTIVLNAFGCTKLVDVDADTLNKGVLSLAYIQHNRREMLETLMNVAPDVMKFDRVYFRFYGEADELNRPIFHFENIERC